MKVKVHSFEQCMNNPLISIDKKDSDRFAHKDVEWNKMLINLCDKEFTVQSVSTDFVWVLLNEESNYVFTNCIDIIEP